jgi:hypothetical protein
MSDTTATPTTTAPAAPVDPWAYLADAGVVVATTFVKAPMTLGEIPLPIQAMLEKALAAKVPMKVKFLDAEMTSKALKFFKGYAIARETTTVSKDDAGNETSVTVKSPVTIRASASKATPTLVHFTVKTPFTPTPKPTIPAPATPAPVAPAPVEKTPQGDHSIAENAAAKVEAKIAAKGRK